MPSHAIAPSRVPFQQTANAIINDVHALSDATVRLIQRATSLPPLNGRNLQGVAKLLGHGRDRFKAGVRELRDSGRHHTRKRKVPEGLVLSQVLVSQVQLLTPDDVRAGWAAAEEAVAAGHDTPASRALGVRILNSRLWLHHPTVGETEPPTTRPSPQGGNRTEEDQTPLPASPQPDAEPDGPEREPETTQEPDDPEADAAEQAAAALLTRIRKSYRPEAQRAVAGLERLDPRLAVPRAMLPQLTDLATEWLMAGWTIDHIRAAVSTDLPPAHELIRHPGGLVRHRLRDLPPPRCAATPEHIPMATCETCDRPYRPRPDSSTASCGPCHRKELRARSGVTADALGDRATPLRRALDTGGGWRAAFAALTP